MSDNLWAIYFYTKCDEFYLFLTSVQNFTRENVTIQFIWQTRFVNNLFFEYQAFWKKASESVKSQSS